jgi:hypothetical protein
MADQSTFGLDARQRRHMRRSALLLALIPLALYAAYMLFALRHGHA